MTSPSPSSKTYAFDILPRLTIVESSSTPSSSNQTSSGSSNLLYATIGLIAAVGFGAYFYLSSTAKDLKGRSSANNGNNLPSDVENKRPAIVPTASAVTSSFSQALGSVNPSINVIPPSTHSSPVGPAKTFSNASTLLNANSSITSLSSPNSGSKRRKRRSDNFEPNKVPATPRQLTFQETHESSFVNITTSSPSIQNHERLLTFDARAWLNLFLGKSLDTRHERGADAQGNIQYETTEEMCDGLLGRPLSDVEKRAIAQKPTTWFFDLINVLSSMEAELYYKSLVGKSIHGEELRKLNSLLPDDLSAKEKAVIEKLLTDEFTDEEDQIYQDLSLKIQRYFILYLYYGVVPTKETIVRYHQEHPIT